MQIIELDTKRAEMQLEVIKAEFEQYRSLLVSTALSLKYDRHNITPVDSDRSLTVIYNGKTHDFIKGNAKDLAEMKAFYIELSNLYFGASA